MMMGWYKAFVCCEEACMCRAVFSWESSSFMALTARTHHRAPSGRLETCAFAASSCIRVWNNRTSSWVEHVLTKEKRSEPSPPPSPVLQLHCQSQGRIYGWLGVGAYLPSSNLDLVHFWPRELLYLYGPTVTYGIILRASRTAWKSGILSLAV